MVLDVAAEMFPPFVNAAIALGVLGGMLALVVLRRRRTREAQQPRERGTH